MMSLYWGWETEYKVVFGWDYFSSDRKSMFHLQKKKKQKNKLVLKSSGLFSITDNVCSKECQSVFLWSMTSIIDFLDKYKSIFSELSLVHVHYIIKHII